MNPIKCKFPQHQNEPIVGLCLISRCTGHYNEQVCEKCAQTCKSRADIIRFDQVRPVIKEMETAKKNSFDLAKSLLWGQLKSLVADLEYITDKIRDRLEYIENVKLASHFPLVRKLFLGKISMTRISRSHIDKTAKFIKEYVTKEDDIIKIADYYKPDKYMEEFKTEMETLVPQCSNMIKSLNRHTSSWEVDQFFNSINIDPTLVGGLEKQSKPQPQKQEEQKIAQFQTQKKIEESQSNSEDAKNNEDHQNRESVVDTTKREKYLVLLNNYINSKDLKDQQKQVLMQIEAIIWEKAGVSPLKYQRSIRSLIDHLERDNHIVQALISNPKLVEQLEKKSIKMLKWLEVVKNSSIKK